jgi:N utilization substance protein A
MTPEQLEEIPGIGEKTLEKISVAVRHYFGHFEEGEEGHVPAENDGESEVETPLAALDTAEAELENASEVLEEAESVLAAEAEDGLSDETSVEASAEAEAETEGLTAAELAVENVPLADEAEEIEASKTENEQAAEESDA